MAEIEIDFHNAESAQIDSLQRLTTLISVPVFVHKDVFLSAPAFITFSNSDYTAEE